MKNDELRTSSSIEELFKSWEEEDKRHPIRSKLRKWRHWLYHTAWYKFEARLFRDRNKYLRKAIPHTWADKCYLFPQLVSTMIVDFVDGEKCFESTAYEDEEWNGFTNNRPQIFASELKVQYEYAKVERPTLLNDHLKEELLDQKDAIMVEWFAKNYKSFWT